MVKNSKKCTHRSLCFSFSISLMQPLINHGTTKYFFPANFGLAQSRNLDYVIYSNKPYKGICCPVFALENLLTEMPKLPKFHLIFWCENSVKKHSFGRVVQSFVETANSHKTSTPTN